MSALSSVGRLYISHTNPNQLVVFVVVARMLSTYGVDIAHKDHEAERDELNLGRANSRWLPSTFRLQFNHRPGRRALMLAVEICSACYYVDDTLETVVGNAICGGTRCSYLKGNFFESVPQGADLYLLSGVLHDWNDRRATQILRNCRRAMAENGKLLLVEMVVPVTNSADFSKLLDLNMMVMNGGRERTKAEFSVLLADAGYKLTRVISTLAPQSIIEAVPR